MANGRVLKHRPSTALDPLIKTYVELRAKIAEHEKTLVEIKAALLEAAVAAGGQVETRTHAVKVVEQERKTISRDRLVTLGVTPKVIDKATTITPVTYARVDKLKAR